MESKKERIARWRLYVIADRAAAGRRDLCDLVAQAIDGGADVIQYRDKTASAQERLLEARRLRRVTAQRNVPLIVNDDLRSALESGADGVHLGQDDASILEARRLLGDGAIVGRSTHTPEQGRKAQAEGFDYIGVGPVFATPTKPDAAPAGLGYVQYAACNLAVPFVAIGGIDESNAGLVYGAGAKMIAVVRAVIGSADPRQSAARLKRIEENQ